jgi:two-component system, cell cycle sensor histidine kinase and response regulator CckA
VNPETDPAAPAAAALRILHAEHDRSDMQLCAQELKRSGLSFQLQTASTPTEFAEKLNAEVNVVLADYRLPGWTGMDALAQVKKLGLDIPVILVTGTLGDGLAVECIKLGVTDYVLKDQLARLPLAIRRALKEKALRQAERQAATALRESEARYRGLVNHATYGIYWVTLEGEILHANPALVNMLGYDSEAELLRLSSSQALYNDHAALERLRSEYQAKGKADGRVEWKCKNGKIIAVDLHGRQIPSIGDRKDCVEVMVEDVTERLALEKQLAQSQKFEAIGQLAGGIAHDFNNMIGAIIGWADLGMEETEGGARLHRHFEKVRQQADRAASLTRQLLAFARRQVLEPRSIDLNQTITETLSLLEKVLGSNIEIKTKLARDLPVVRADPTQIEQVVMNLCINARDAMPEGGALLIETQRVSFDQQFCDAQPFARPGYYCMVCITDTGTGMDAATLDRIFEPFFTTKEMGKGTGLGLATVYGIVRQHGGFSHVYSEVGVGTTFRVYLPMTPAMAAQAEKEADSRPVKGGSETILIAEDHEGLREIARETLANQGYRVLLVSDGERALREFQANRDRIDLVILDVVLPKISGPEVYARILAEKPETPVLFATGYSADMAMLQKIQDQNLPVLQKPYSPRDLAGKVRETLDQHARMLSRS